MERISDYEPGSPLTALAGCIATIGVFDGVHLGHRAILDHTLAWARTERRPAVLLTFSAHPDQVVHGRSPLLLMSLEHRLREIDRIGLDACVILPFDAQLRQLSAEQFVHRILVESLATRGLVLGHDTAVGRDRQGDATVLGALGESHGFEVRSVGQVGIDGQVVSSTGIRSALLRGDLALATSMLGRSPSLLGTVVPGDGRGRTIGFPTANLDVASECRPADGVYAVLVLEDGETWKGLCNVGRRPTFRVAGPPLVEVHLLDYEGDLYGRRLEVVFLRRLRPEQTFRDAEQLRHQIEKDREAACQAFASLGPGRRP